MKFKSDIEVQAGIKDSAGSSGNAGSILSSTSTGVTWIDNYSDWTSVVKHVVKNNGVAVIPKGSPVYVTGSDGTNMLVGLAGNGSEATSSKTMGIVQTQLGTSGSTQTGYVITEGLLQGLNTAGLTAGDPIWLGPNGTLIYGLANKPYAPAHLVFIGIVTKISAGNGEIFVNVQNGFELNEIHDVDIKTNIPINGEVLGFDGTLWVNKTIAGWLGYIPADDAAVVHLTGNEYIAGEKTFGNYIKAQDGIYLYKNSPSLAHISGYTTLSGAVNGYVVIVNSATTAEFNFAVGTNASYTYPVNSGTFALTSDLLSLVPYAGATSSVNLGSNYITASAFIKTDGTSAQILAADGSVITAGSGITISGGTISATGAGYVPYTGATSNVNLGTYSISASNYILGGATGNTGLYYGHTNKVVLANYVVGGGIDFETNGGATNMILDAAGDLSVVGNITADSFIKIGGNSTQYLKADGSVSTAMNSRIEVNFIATAGQTTFVTPYEVGQVDVYYNGSKLYPNEFTATNGTDIILATGATLNAQISIVKYVSSLSTTAIRNETTFTTTAGQTTFAVNYSPGQVDVFYNGSKLNISEFTAVNGTSVVLGFACAAGESIVIDSYVNQISGASGTPDFVSKFTGPASLGNSQIFDNGVNLGIDTITPEGKLTVKGTSAQPPVSGTTANSLLQLVGSLNNQLNIGCNTSAGGYGSYIQASDNNLAVPYSLNLQPNGGNVGIGTTSPYCNLAVGSTTSANGEIGFIPDFEGSSEHALISRSSSGFKPLNIEGGTLRFWTGSSSTTEQVRITSNGNINFNSTVYNNTAVATTRTLYIGSDYRIGGISSIRKSKKNIENILNVDWIYQLNPVTFNYRKKDEEGEYTEETYDELVYGLIAEDTEPIANFLVNYNEKDGEKEMIGIEYSRLITPMLKAIQEQNVMLQELKAEIEILKNK